MTFGSQAIAQTKRLLSTLDSNETSSTYGCFDREYWLNRAKDFPDGLRQFSLLALAYSYKMDINENIYYRKKHIHNCIKASIRYTKKVQGSDGAFDEFYPGEKSWGVTAFILHAVSRTNIILKSMGNEYLGINIIKSAANYIRRGEHEGDQLTNHYAMAALGLAEAEAVLDTDYSEAITKLYDQIKQYRGEGGWFNEYDGCDYGYLTFTITLLAQLIELREDDSHLINWIDEAICFAAHGIQHKKAYGGIIGTRGTRFFSPYGFYYRAKNNKYAAAVVKLLKEVNKTRGDTIGVSSYAMDDRHFYYHIPAYYKTADYVQNQVQMKHLLSDAPSLPFQKEQYYKQYKQVGVWCRSADERYTISNLQLGGSIKTSSSNGKLTKEDGITLITDKNEILTTHWSNKYCTVTNENGWVVKGQLNKIPSPPQMTVGKQILFRLVMAAVKKIPYGTALFKKWLRERYITGAEKTNIHFVRRYSFDDERCMTTLYPTTSSPTIHRIVSGMGNTRYVPQANYFQEYDLHNSTRSYSGKKVQEINNGKTIKIKTELSSC